MLLCFLSSKLQSYFLFFSSFIFVLDIIVVANVNITAFTSSLGTLNFLLHFTEGEKPETKQKRLEAKYAALQIVPNIEKLGNPKVRFSVYAVTSLYYM
jgi:hypothetical protein